VLDSQKPLVGLIQDAQCTVSLPASCPSPAIVDVSENTRSNLYAIFCKMGKFSCTYGSQYSSQLSLAIRPWVLGWHNEYHYQRQLGRKQTYCVMLQCTLVSQCKLVSG